MSESVYYMDRRSDILITDKQVVVGRHHYNLAQIKDVNVDSRHDEAARKTELLARIVTLAAVLGIGLSRLLLITNARLEGTVFELSMITVTAGMIVLLMIGLMEKSLHAVVVKRYDGAREEVCLCADKQRARLIMDAVRDALDDYRDRRNANNRGAMHDIR